MGRLTDAQLELLEEELRRQGEIEKQLEASLAARWHLARTLRQHGPSADLDRLIEGIERDRAAFQQLKEFIGALEAQIYAARRRRDKRE